MGNEGGKKEGKGKAQISTKSGYERKLENKRRGAIEGSRRRTFGEKLGRRDKDDADAEESEWSGID